MRKRYPGRKTDVADCQWLQELHTYGLLSGSFRPLDQVCVLRSYLRHRDNLVKAAGSHIQHMQKALTEMNIALHHAVTDITGVSGMAIIGAMLGGERDLNKLAAMKDRRVKKSVAQIALALEGDWRKEHLFALGQAFELYQIYQNKIAQCDQQIEAAMRKLWNVKPSQRSSTRRAKLRRLRPPSSSRLTSNRSAAWI